MSHPGRFNESRHCPESLFRNLYLLFLLNLGCTEPEHSIRDEVVGTWQGGGLMPQAVTYSDDGTFKSSSAEGTMSGTWRVRDMVLITEVNQRVRRSTIVELREGFMRVRTESGSVFGYHRIE